MKKTSAAIGALLTAFSTSVASAAGAPDMSKVNPNAIIRTLLENADATAGRLARVRPYMEHEDFSPVCIGDIPVDGVMMYDRKKNERFYKPVVLNIVKFAQDPNAKDLVAQEKIKSLLKSPKNLVYIQYQESFAPSATEISSYLKKATGSEPLDIYQAGTGLRDGSTSTGILLDRQAFEKFATANAARIMAIDAKFQQEYPMRPSYYSSCGPALPKN